MGIKIFCIEDNKRYEITSMVKGSISWGKTIDEFAQKLSFEIYAYKLEGMPVNPVKLGSIIEIQSEKVEFSGIVISNDESKGSISYSAVDFTFYFTQNEEIYQFQKVKASSCIESIILSMDAPIGIIDKIDVEIDKIYFNSSAGGVIKDIIKIIEAKKGIKFHFYFRGGKFHFRREMDSISTFEVDFFNKKYNATYLSKDVSVSRSIENLKNSIKVVIKNNETEYKSIESKDQKNIDKYGLLQKVEVIEADNPNDSKSIADNLLKKRNLVEKKVKIVIPWVENLYDGDNIIIKNSLIEGLYTIKAFTKNRDSISLELIPYG